MEGNGKGERKVLRKYQKRLKEENIQKARSGRYSMGGRGRWRKEEKEGRGEGGGGS